MDDYSQLLRSSAMAGLLFGAYWVLKYLCLMAIFAAPMMAFLYLILTLMVPFLAYYLTKRYRNTFPPGSRFSFMHGFRYSIMLYLFAALIVSIPHFIFYSRILPANMDLIMAQMEQMSSILDQMYGSDWREIMSNAFNVKPAYRVGSDISTNVFWGIVFSIPVGLILKRKAIETPH